MGQSGAGHPVELAGEGHRALGPQLAEQPDLLLEPSTPAVEVLAQRLVLDGVPSDADTEPESTPGQEIDFGGLLRHQHRRALRQDRDPGDQLERRASGQESEHDERLVELGIDVVGTGPVPVDRRIGAHHVVVGQEVLVPEVLHALPVGTNGTDGWSDFGLRQDDADPHCSAPGIAVAPPWRAASTLPPTVATTGQGATNLHTALLTTYVLRYIVIARERSNTPPHETQGAVDRPFHRTNKEFHHMHGHHTSRQHSRRAPR